MRRADGPVHGAAHLTFPSAAALGPLPLPPKGRRGLYSRRPARRRGRARAGAGWVRICSLLLLLPVAAFSREAQYAAPAGKWTRTDPPINLVHIDFGEINSHGEAVGYHHRAHGVDPGGARVVEIVQSPDAQGVYRARVEIRDPATGAWVRKKAPSTFYPDAMSDGDVVAAILAAFHRGKRRGNGQFVGDSGRGFTIEGWYQNGRINAAYPLRGP